MYKGRIGIWIIVLLLCFSVSGLIKWVPTWFDSNDLTTKIEISNDIGFSEVIAGDKFNGLKIVMKDNDTDVIITDKKDYIDGYTKYENQLYSPMVMYVSDEIMNYSSGFINVGNSNYIHKVDLYTILTAMLEDKKFEDIGINNKVVNGPVTIYIPNEQSAYFDDVVELFYLTLNNGEIPNDEEKANLKNKVDNIVKKCNKVVDINQEIYLEYKDSSKTHKIFIGPEFLFRRGIDGSMSRNYSNSFTIVYFIKTVFIHSDIFVKESDDSTLNNGEKFIENISSKKRFMSECGWRIRNSTFNVSDISNAYLKNPI